MFAFFLPSLSQMIICKRCPNRFLSVILTISGYLIVFCSVRCENRSFRDSVIAKLPMFCSSSALASEKHRFLVQFPHFARFTDRSGRSTFCNFVKHQFSGGLLMRICEIVALDPHLSLRICLDFIFKSASTLTRRVKGTLTPVISLTHRVKGRTLSTSLQVGIYSNPQSEGHTHTGSFFHTQSEGEHSPSLSHTRTLALFHKVEGSLTHSKVGYTLTRSLTSQSRTQS